MSSEKRVDVRGGWKVTYFNVLDGQRHLLIDDIDEATAKAVVTNVSDKSDPYTYLPEVRKEIM